LDAHGHSLGSPARRAAERSRRLGMSTAREN
jgi:hypothetical protein